MLKHFQPKFTPDGHEIIVLDDDMTVTTDHRRHHFHFGDMGLHTILKDAFHAFVLNRLTRIPTYSAEAAYTLVRRLLLHIVGYDVGAQSISSAHLINYSTSLDDGNRYLSTDANTQIQRWADLGIDGLDEDTHITAGELPRYVRKTQTAITLLCPKHGSYTNLEFTGLYRALAERFAAGAISLTNYALCLTSGALGARPIQLASLQIRDLKIESSPSGKTYVLMVPQAKQRNGGFRKGAIPRPLIRDIGMILEAQARIVQAKAQAGGMEKPDEAPLFPAEMTNSTFFVDTAHPIRPTPSSISMRITETMEGLDVVSERTGEPINATATRARKTIGTRAAEEGRTASEIAELLGHSSTGPTSVYVDTSGALLQAINKKLAMYMAPLAQRFLGTIIEGSRSPNDKSGPPVFGSVNIGDAPVDLGNCGKLGYCGLGRPTACYTCRLFRPWLDGPHEMILDSLMTRKEGMEANGSRVVAASLDEVIVACAEVVRQCQLRKAALDDINYV